MATPLELCPDDVLMKLTELAAADTRKGLRRAEVLLGTYADDPRLHFLKGSLFAALQRFPEAAAPMRRAIEIAPDFHIARFQLGLLLLTSGMAQEAADVWAPLGALDSKDPLRLFAAGLQHMSRDEFAEAERLLLEGIAANSDHPALNGDMQMVLGQMRDVSSQSTDGESSDAHWLLQVSASRQTKH
jgi:Flp pilus assembly protein TadD